MKTLYWHRWTARGRTSWLLFDFPQTHSPMIRSLGELAIVFKTFDAYQASIQQIGKAAAHWSCAKSLIGGRRIVEEWIDRKSIGMFDDDDVEFITPEGALAYSNA